MSTYFLPSVAIRHRALLSFCHVLYVFSFVVFSLIHLPSLQTTAYHYIGGFYGACTPTAMMVELVQNGPIAVSFEVRFVDFDLS